MSRNGSGSYSLPAPYPSGFQNGTAIDAPTMNTVFTDVQSALTASTAADGQTPITGNWNFGGKNISNVNTFSAVGAVFIDISVSGGTSTKGLAVGTGGVTVAAGGVGVVGNSTIDGTLGVTGGITGDALQIGSGGPTWTVGTGAPVAVTPLGSIYSRTDGGVGTTLYVSQGAGVWNPVAGV